LKSKGDYGGYLPWTVWVSMKEEKKDIQQDIGLLIKLKWLIQ